MHVIESKSKHTIPSQTKFIDLSTMWLIVTSKHQLLYVPELVSGYAFCEVARTEPVCKLPLLAHQPPTYLTAIFFAAHFVFHKFKSRSLNTSAAKTTSTRHDRMLKWVMLERCHTRLGALCQAVTNQTELTSVLHN